MSSESDTISQVLDCIIYYCILDQAHCGGQLKYCHVISQYSFIHLAATYLPERYFEPWYSRELLLMMMITVMMVTMMFIVYITVLLKTQNK